MPDCRWRVPLLLASRMPRIPLVRYRTVWCCSCCSHRPEEVRAELRAGDADWCPAIVSCADLVADDAVSVNIFCMQVFCKQICDAVFGRAQPGHQCIFEGAGDGGD